MILAPTLKRTLTLRFVLASVAPLLLVCAFLLNHIYVETMAEIEAENLSDARNTASQVELFLESPLNTLSDLGDLANQSRDADLDQSIAKLLNFNTAKGELFETIYLLDKSGTVKEIGLPETQKDQRREFLNLDFGHLEVFKAAQKSGKPVWSDTFSSVISGAHSIALCVPAGEHLLLGHLRIDSLKEFVQERAGKGTATTILDNKGEVIAHSRPPRPNTVLDFSAVEIVRKSLGGEETTGRFFLQDEEFLGSAVRVSGPGWLVLHSHLVNQALARFYMALNYFIAGIALSLALALTIAGIQAKTLAAPLSALAEATTRLAVGDYSVPEERQPYRESQILDESFRSMSTALRSREESLVAAERKLRHLLESINAAPWEYDVEEDCYTYIGPQLEKLIGPMDADWKNAADWIAHLHPEDRESVRLSAWRSTNRSSDYEATYRLVGQGGKTVWVREIVTADRKSGDGKKLLAGVIIDITGEKTMLENNELLQRQVAQVQRLDALGTLAGGIAHDFNNVLAAILGYAELAQMKLPPDSEIRDDLAQVIGASERAKTLVRQILAYSRMRQSDKVAVQLSSIVTESLKFLRATLPTDIEIRSSVGTRAMVLSDPSQMHQVVMNLCTNAAKAMAGGGILTVGLSEQQLGGDFTQAHKRMKPGPHVLLTVEDTGVGIPPEIQEHIFEPFFTTRAQEGGTGLGLSVVYGIIADMGGAVTLQSAPGVGTKFSVWLPIHNGEGIAENTTQASHTCETGSERILVVDDEPALVDLYESMLGSLGYGVTVARGSLEALEIFKNAPCEFDLVITDMTMPAMTGDALTEKLKEVDPKVKVILCTGYSERLGEEKLKKLKVESLLMKPITMASLSEAIRKALGNKGSDSA